MSRTIRWWQKPNIKKASKRIKEWDNRKVNPFFFKHEDKIVKLRTSRKARYKNKQNCKIAIKKLQNNQDAFLEFEKPRYTCGWETY